MMLTLRKFFGLATAIVVGACGACSVSAPAAAPTSPPQPPAIDRDDIKHALDSAITLYKPDAEEGYRNICSGVRVSPTRIVTAYHCVLAAALPDEMLQLIEQLDPMFRNTTIVGLIGTKEYFSRKLSDFAHEATVLAVDPANDMAILSTEWSYQPSAPVRSTRGEVGEDVFAIGNPLGLRYTFTRGWVSFSCREYDEEPGTCWTQVDLTVGPGNSGGGLYDADGMLMGLCSHGWGGFDFNMFSDPEALAKLVGANA
jgi:S1-C subfamily serine protease